MEKLNILDKINNLTAVSLGSFGEFIYKIQILEKTDFEIYKGHQDRFDFLVNDEMIDVKATKKNIIKNQISLKLFKGNRVSERIYAQVEFFIDSVRISHEEIELFNLDLNEINILWNRWKKNDSPKLSLKGKSPSRENAKLIKEEITNFFSKINIKTRIIYRTVQGSFGKESPGNLKPNKIIDNRLTIFLNFYDHNVSKDNFNSIIAFNDLDSKQLPMLTKTNLGISKVDLNKMNKKYIFNNLIELFDDYKRIL